MASTVAPSGGASGREGIRRRHLTGSMPEPLCSLHDFVWWEALNTQAANITDETKVCWCLHATSEITNRPPKTRGFRFTGVTGTLGLAPVALLIVLVV